MSKSINATSGKTSASFPLFGILGIVFITLKLCNVISWSWWMVLSPFWIPFALFVFVFAIVVVVQSIKG